MTDQKKSERDPRLDQPCEKPYELVNSTTREVINIPCGSRLNDECPSCAVRYQIVQRRILDEGQPAFPDAADLVLGQAQLPSAAFVTLTLPSFGPLTEGHAPRHPRTYRYAAQVVSSVLEPEMLRAWGEAFRRATKDWRDAGFDVYYRGSREVQERGAGHYHLVVVVNPNTPEWDGVTRVPSGAEVKGRIEAIQSGTAAVPAELTAHINSTLVDDRRDQLGLATASADTLRVPARVRFGKQQDVQAINLQSDPTKDGNSFGRKASYISKAFSYTVKDLGDASGKAGRRNKAHLTRLRLESFAMIGDYRATLTVRRWLDKHITQLWNEYTDTPAHLRERRPGLLAELAPLLRARKLLNSIVRWDFLDEVTAKDLLASSPLWRFFNGRAQKVWVAVSLLRQLGLQETLTAEDLRYLVKNLGVVLRRVVRFYGHTGSAVVSSQWPVTATMIREAQKAWVIRQLIESGELAFGPQPLRTWEPLYRPRRWNRSMAGLLPS